jgi:hypothetical protein
MNKPTVSNRVASLFFIIAMFVTGSAFAGDSKFSATPSGAQEVDEVDTPAMGNFKAKFDKGLTKVSVDLEVKNLVGSATGVHLHCARPGANGPVVLGLMNPGPLSFNGKKIRGTLTNADFSVADCSTAVGRPVNNIAALAFAMRDGLIYVNVHSDFSPGGEIRGQVK